MKHATILIFLCAFLAACQTIDPYTGQSKISNAATYGGLGALAGAALGAGTGAIFGGGKGAAIGAASGAVLGGVAGGLWGHNIDKAEADLRARLQGTGVQVRRVGNRLELVMRDNITFNIDSAVVRPEFYPVLESVAIVARRFRAPHLVVIGHTDSTGSSAYNDRLSLERAQAVARVLVQYGVNPSRLIIEGRGEREPIASNGTPAGRAMNRRVVIQMY